MIEFSRRNERSWSIMGINPSIWSIGFAEIAEQNENVAVITADLARYSGLERMMAKYSDRFYNVGIAEQNMLGIAAGMAMEGMQTYITTYAPFVTLRCADQVRHLMGNMNLNIKAVGSAAGLSSGWSGSALLAINDIAFMRSIPNMTVLCPADCTEAVKMMLAMSKLAGPVYMRVCGSVKIPCVYMGDYDFEIGKAVIIQEGEQIAFIASGIDIVSETIKAGEIIKESLGICPTIVNMHTIKPLDKECIRNIAKTHDLIITVEEHNVIGGLGSAVSECVASLGQQVEQIIIGIEDTNCALGERRFMLEQSCLVADKIVQRTLKSRNLKK